MKSRFVIAAFGLALFAASSPGFAAPNDPVQTKRWPIDVRERPMLGLDTAPVVVVEIASFKCSHCRSFHENIFPTLRTEYIDTGKVQWVVLNASDDPADEFAKIFSIARCALRQGKYWEMLDSFFAVAHRPSSALTDLVAKSPLLDKGELEICLRERSTRTALTADFSDYRHLKLHGTPSFLVSRLASDGSRTDAAVAGLQTLDYFRQVLDKMVKVP